MTTQIGQAYFDPWQQRWVLLKTCTNWGLVAFSALTIAFLVGIGCSGVQAEPEPIPRDSGQTAEVISANVQAVAYFGNFPRIPADTVMPTGQSVAVDCQDPDAAYPYTPYDWPDASASLEILQGVGSSTVKVEVSNVKPKTYYTIWLRLNGTDSSGNSFGGSPLTGIPGTPLLPTSELATALAGISEPVGDEINGFYTDEQGNASFKIDLDFPIINGAYPFQKFEGFDPKDERFPIDAPSAQPVAIVGPNGPFTLRLVSHCTDGLGHGLLPGPHEGWFQWKFE